VSGGIPAGFVGLGAGGVEGVYFSDGCFLFPPDGIIVF
jgi:hypothetical protein